MGFLTGFVDVQDSDGESILPNGAVARDALVLRLGAGLAGTYAKSGDQGIVTVVPEGSSAPVAGSSLTLGSQSPAQVVVDVADAASAQTGNVTVASVTVAAGKMAVVELHVTLAVHVPALGFYTFGHWAGVITIRNGGIALAVGTSDNADHTFLGAPFGSTSPTTLDFGGSGTTKTILLGPIDLVTAYTGVEPSGAWAQSKSVTGSVEGSGTALGIGENNTILASGNGRWYFYTAGTTSNSGTGPTHTSGQASDGSATAYHGGLVSAGVPMTVTVTWRQVETGGA